MNIVLIPADDRPVSYSLPGQTGQISHKNYIFAPPRELLGNLQKTANISEILVWLEKTCAENRIDYIICALDTIAYGGLIPSRRSADEKALILSRIDEFRRVISGNNAKILAFSSIMRISNNNINEEEKLYWDKYGELIFKYSYLKHKGDDYSFVESQISPEILDDYLKTRERNFEVNKTYSGQFDFLLYTKDDTAPYGLNVQEAGELSKYGRVHTGFDEVMTLLVARAINCDFEEKIRIFPVYSTPKGSEIIARYEDIPLGQNVRNHIELCGAELAAGQEDADIILLVHTPEKAQNELALEIFAENESDEAVDFCVELIRKSPKPVILADVKNANGSDNLLIRKLLSEDFDLYGYAGWNTASNTIGTALPMGIIRYIAEKQGCFSAENFKKLLFTRFMDDWAYQANIRSLIRRLKINANEIKLTFPWDRSFEVEIDFS